MMNETDEITHLHYKMLVEPLIEDPFRFREKWLIEKNWLVVPAADQQHFTNEQISGIVASTRAVGAKSLFAIDMEGIAPIRSGSYEFSSSSEDLEEFNTLCGMFFYLVSNQQLSWAISCNNEYNLFAGETHFLETVLGSQIRTAELIFQNYAEQAGSVSSDLIRVAEHYRAINEGRH